MVKDVPVSTLLAGGLGGAGGVWAMGGSEKQMICGAGGYALGAMVALGSGLCDAAAGDTTSKSAKRAYGSGSTSCLVMFPDNKEYGITRDTLAGLVVMIPALWWCNANWKEMLAGVAGAGVASTGVQYWYNKAA